MIDYADPETWASRARWQREQQRRQWTSALGAAGLAMLFLVGSCAIFIGVDRETDEPTLRDVIIGDNVQRVQEMMTGENLVQVRGATGPTPLFYARSKEIADLLIDQGAGVNVASQHGCTPLHFAAGRGAVDVVETLLARGANVNQRDTSGQRPLHWAVEIMILPETEFDGPGRTAQRQVETVKLLLAQGADVDARDIDGRTALHRAARGGRRAVVQLLLAHGADPAARDLQGRTPAAYATPDDAETREILKAEESRR